MIADLGSRAKSAQRAAAEELSRMAAEAVEVRGRLLATLNDADARRRWGAAYALSLSAAVPVQVLDVLLERLGDDDGDLRWAALGILLRLRGFAGLLSALQHLARVGNAEQRKMAIYCLRDLDACGAEIEATVREATADPGPGVRLAAIAYLVRGAVDRPAAARAVLDRLDDTDAGVRRAAAASLGILGERNEEVVRALVRLAHGDDPSLARAASRAIERLLRPNPTDTAESIG